MDTDEAAHPLLTRILVWFKWPVSCDSARLTPDVLEKLRPYLTRYGQTLQIRIFAVGGTPDTLNVLLKLPPTRTLFEMETELKDATRRFLCDVLHLPFAWSEKYAGFAGSCDADSTERRAAFINQMEHYKPGGTHLPEEINEETGPNETANDDEPLPLWLTEAMKNAGKKTR